MSEELTMDQKMAMVREAKPSYAKNELIEKWQDAGRLINSERKAEARKELMQSSLFEKTVGTKLPLHKDGDEVVRGGGVIATTEVGAFYGFYTVASEGDDNGDIYLQGGTINSEAVATMDLKLYDALTDTWEGIMDEHLLLSVDGVGLVEDGVLLPGFTVSTPIGILVDVPAGDTHPTALDDSGNCLVSLGVFTGSGFLPSALGNRSITFCPGGTFIVTP